MVSVSHCVKHTVLMALLLFSFFLDRRYGEEVIPQQHPHSPPSLVMRQACSAISNPAYVLELVASRRQFSPLEQGLITSILQTTTLLAVRMKISKRPPGGFPGWGKWMLLSLPLCPPLSIKPLSPGEIPLFICCKVTSAKACAFEVEN